MPGDNPDAFNNALLNSFINIEESANKVTVSFEQLKNLATVGNQPKVDWGEDGPVLEPVEELVAEPEGPIKEFLAQRQEEMLVWYPRTNGAKGYDDQTIVVDPIRHFNIQDLLAGFFIQCHANFGVVKNWRRNVIGITSMYFGSRSMRGPNMPMFDYDGKNVKKQIRKDVKLLQEKYGLGDASVYETRRGFHVYFFSDIVDRDAYFEMLEAVDCCKGFKRSAQNRGHAVLRVSAKYTDFDIKFHYTLACKSNKLRRMTRKAHTIRALLQLGEECGTHFASLYPQWAHFQQDPVEWKPAPKGKRPRGKRIRKSKTMKMKNFEAVYNSPIQSTKAIWGESNTTSSTTSTNTWVSSNKVGSTSDPF